MYVRAIRGATTVENNDANEIISETKKLLNEIIVKNDIVEEDIASIIFTVTKDLDAAFPAVAARQLEWTSVPLICSYEIDVPGSLKSCIRILMHVNSEKSNKDMIHIYLKGAKVLRPDLVRE
jgi:chorismate mutase